MKFNGHILAQESSIQVYYTGVLSFEKGFIFLIYLLRERSEREKMFQNIYEVFPNIRQNSLKIQFLWLMSQENEKCTTDIAKFVTQSMTLRTKELDILLNLNNARTTRGKI